MKRARVEIKLCVLFSQLQRHHVSCFLTTFPAFLTMFPLFLDLSDYINVLNPISGSTELLICCQRFHSDEHKTTGIKESYRKSCSVRLYCSLFTFKLPEGCSSAFWVIYSHYRLELYQDPAAGLYTSPTCLNSYPTMHCSSFLQDAPRMHSFYTPNSYSTTYTVFNLILIRNIWKMWAKQSSRPAAEACGVSTTQQHAILPLMSYWNLHRKSGSASQEHTC